MSEEKEVKKISWKQVWMNVLFCAAVVVIVNLISSGCGWLWSNIQEFRDYRRGESIERYDDYRPEWDEGSRVRPFEDWRGVLERYVQGHLPPSARPEMVSNIAELFRKTAGKVDAGKLRFRADTIAELNRGLQVAADRKWIPFFAGLMKIADQCGIESGEETADFLRVCADVLGGVDVPNGAAEEDSVDEESEADREKKNEDVKQVEVNRGQACVGGFCVAPGGMR